MRAGRPLPRWILRIVGLVLGGAAGVATVSLASAAAPVQQPPAGARAVFDATHLPPLLTLPGEQVELSYEVHCAASGVDDVDAGCDVRGTVFVRGAGDGSFDAVPLTGRRVDGLRQLVATAPESLVSGRDGFEYYAVLEAPGLDETITLPVGGADAPHASRRMENVVTVSLDRHTFGRLRSATDRVASAGWGTAPADAGLEPGRHVGPIGPSGFDVDASGTVVVLDQANHRLLRWRPGVRAPARVPVSVAGTLADMTLANDGSIFVLETTARPGQNPLVRRFDDNGRELEAVEMAEWAPSQILMAPNGPVVLGHPSHHWVPVVVNGTPASPAVQVRHGRPSRPLRGGGEIVVFRRANELRLALLAGPNLTRSWRVTSGTSLAEVQLAELIGQRLVVVLRMYDERSDEFVILVLDRGGIVDRFSIAPADWAETAPLGRFRLVGKSLYRLGSTAAGMFVDRFELEVR